MDLVRTKVIRGTKGAEQSPSVGRVESLILILALQLDRVFLPHR